MNKLNNDEKLKILGRLDDYWKSVYPDCYVEYPDGKSHFRDDLLDYFQDLALYTSMEKLAKLDDRLQQLEKRPQVIPLQKPYDKDIVRLEAMIKEQAEAMRTVIKVQNESLLKLNNMCVDLKSELDMQKAVAEVNEMFKRKWWHFLLFWK